MNSEFVGAVQCPRCKDVIISLYHYDCHFCSCGDTMIDGGREYVRTGFKPGQAPAHIQIKLVGGLNWKRLSENDKLGRIKTRNFVYGVLYDYTLNEKGKLYRYPKKPKGVQS